MDDLNFLQQNFASNGPVKNATSFSSSVFPGIAIRPLNSSDLFMGMVARSKAMKEILEKIKKLSNTDSTVLVTGPSGCGKELVAKAIHSLSARKFNQFVSVNCGAIPDNLLESELFGHRRGSFTGAIKDKKGRFENANQGTLFLDEIGDMPVSLQVKLLRVMQSRVVEPVGALSGIAIDVRVVSATHRDLEALIDEGKFREDLFYRLNVIPLPIPSLCSRKEDIAPLVEYFVKNNCENEKEKEISFNKDAYDCLLAYDWPGNIRELENLVERLIILKSGQKITVNDLPAKIRENTETSSVASADIDSSFCLPKSGIDMKAHIENIEYDLICQALRMTKGNKNQAAKLLKLNRTTLIEKMKKKKIFVEQVVN